jgi:uncharacterized membrane protein (UPF0127 family)
MDKNWIYKNWLPVVCFVVVVIGLLIQSISIINDNKVEIKHLNMGTITNSYGVAKRSVFITAVTSLDDKVNGLTVYDSLEEDYGMLFLYDDINTKHFHMYRMKFPIDIIFLENHKITKIYESVPICSVKFDACTIYSGEADAVLEVPAGFVEKSSIIVGDRLIFNK